ncbi:hypothetical protein PTTW11_11216 [Pyrenophora teres f. teres]|uniref:Uncharacterized protein n=1 Tax=Pyrenophora teres f. teres TaxID=97479 RepID=A0A6S6WHU5_9PLEO|nr:hypothetical protein PTTW11_11216 [Pyrenophora teres f. teres]
MVPRTIFLEVSKYGTDSGTLIQSTRRDPPPPFKNNYRIQKFLNDYLDAANLQSKRTPSLPEGVRLKCSVACRRYSTRRFFWNPQQLEDYSAGFIGNESFIAIHLIVSTRTLIAFFITSQERRAVDYKYREASYLHHPPKDS